METIYWGKFPSVFTGGKKFFLIAETSIGKRWIIWSRRIKSYVVQDEHVIMCIPVKSIAEGKRIVEEQVNGRLR
jgi:hypothetical protein